MKLKMTFTSIFPRPPHLHHWLIFILDNAKQMWEIIAQTVLSAPSVSPEAHFVSFANSPFDFLGELYPHPEPSLAKERHPRCRIWEMEPDLLAPYLS
ncbi:hypothetical protein QJS04_geneDACA021915 [Acorus gramineus]|uniref:Uncharacterized protein n=1 Tax=Acorus gramineus TaxID=55184 RepID=A0AAV9A588_ACOGR|nr:hypothetical protein QJS04_geneDACA021915 [Acorus gramineus]